MKVKTFNDFLPLLQNIAPFAIPQLSPTSCRRPIISYAEAVF